MAIPSVAALMLPLLKLGTVGEFHVQDAAKLLSDQFNLTQEERERLHPKGKIPVIHDRVVRTVIKLANLKLLHRTSKGRFITTVRGKEALARAPDKIDKRFLKKLRGFSTAPIEITHVEKIPTDIPNANQTETEKQPREGMPDFATLILPVLKLGATGEYHVSEATKLISDQFELTQKEREETTRGGKGIKIDKRVQWAVSHLVKARLLHRPKRGYFTITEQGKALLADPPPKIDVKYLKEHTDYLLDDNQPNVSSAEKRIGSACDEITKDLKKELLSRVVEAPSEFFDGLIIKLLESMGYGGFIRDSGRRTDKSSDAGLYGVVNEDRLGMDVIHVHARQVDSDGTIDWPEIEKFATSLTTKGAHKGLFITAGAYSDEAKKYAANISQRLILLGKEELLSLMVEHNVGVRPDRMIELKKLDEDFFME